MVVHSVVAGSTRLSKSTWGRFRYAGMTRAAFEFSSFALIISVITGWIGHLELSSAMTVQTWGHGIAVMLLGIAYAMVASRPKFKRGRFVALVAFPVLCGALVFAARHAIGL